MQNKEIKQRNIALYLVLTVVTLGIFSIYWQYHIYKDIYTLLDKDDNALLDIILIIASFGIYGLFVWYKISIYLYQISQSANQKYEPSSTLFIVLSAIQLNIILCFIVQTELNYYIPLKEVA